MSFEKILNIFCFKFLRPLENYPIFYPEFYPKILIDITLFRLIAIFSSILIAFLIILPGFRENKKLFVFIRWFLSFLILFLMIFCNFMPYWERGIILNTNMPYRFGSNLQINANLGLNIGLRGLNITLAGNPIQQHNDTIDFNEYFDWTWSQGKPPNGFGQLQSGTLQKNYRQAQFKGLPYPILWIVETFTIDFEQIRIGRYYRQSGWYTHIFLWTSVPLFLLANILFQMVIYYGSLFIIFTGISLLIGNIIWIYLKCSIPFTLAFNDEFLITNYSWCFYLNLFNGILCILIGIITLIADLRLPDETAEFFGNDVLQSYEDYFADPQEQSTSLILDELNGIESKSDNEILLRKKQRTNNKDEESNINQRHITSGLKKRTLSERFSRFQKSTIRKTVKQPDSTKTTDIGLGFSGPGAVQTSVYPVTGGKNLKQRKYGNINNNNNNNGDDDDDEMPLYENFHHLTTTTTNRNHEDDSNGTKKTLENEM